ncbi:hypothetical protein B0I35DRAFT_431975 [Stachybotrys elegans]|uniref:Uncharacterized protein n=1 Tax=Stachybotrys elegans TaxID=80388 RepID=A0A8K0SWB0_9HYPO|nr:hypothetical protein B0I35DRAFT_431975 [Stachybotrys elegans]
MPCAVALVHSRGCGHYIPLKLRCDSAECPGLSTHSFESVLTAHSWLYCDGCLTSHMASMKEEYSTTFQMMRDTWAENSNVSMETKTMYIRNVHMRERSAHQAIEGRSEELQQMALAMRSWISSYGQAVFTARHSEGPQAEQARLAMEYMKPHIQASWGMNIVHWDDEPTSHCVICRCRTPEMSDSDSPDVSSAPQGQTVPRAPSSGPPTPASNNTVLPAATADGRAVPPVTPRVLPPVPDFWGHDATQIQAGSPTQYEVVANPSAMLPLAQHEPMDPSAMYNVTQNAVLIPSVAFRQTQNVATAPSTAGRSIPYPVRYNAFMGYLPEDTGPGGFG